MRIIKTVAQAKKHIAPVKKTGQVISFVPTMGYLHEGHLSLVRIARKRADFVVVSIFVNPTQFAPGEDLKKYPRDMKRDKALLKKEGVDLIFYPRVRDMYPPPYKTYVCVKDLSRIMCGITRPDHFQGVTTVVLKLFNIIEPDIAVFGAKDYQQALIIKQMVRDLDLNIRIITGRIIREKDGLAMSSRNKYLSSEQRRSATVLYQALNRVKQDYKKGFVDPGRAKKVIERMIEKKTGRVDYIAVVDKNALQPVKNISKGTLIALAAYFGRTRLIDNILI
jgi:pantoate--beta-alanine ligase